MPIVETSEAATTLSWEHRRFDIVAIGEAMVEFNQTGGGHQRNYLQGFGGDTSNAVIAAARQGAKCAYFTKLGDDDFGRLCLDLWKTEGVDTSSVGIDASAHTGIYFVRHTPEGHSFSYMRANSAASKIQPADIPWQVIKNAKYLHVSGISQAISASATQSVHAAILLARLHGTQVAYDPNLRLRLWSLELAREVITQTIALCDIFLPSLDDVQLVSQLESPTDIIAWCHQAGAKTVVLKLSSQGSMVSDGRSCVAIDSFKVEPVDATGAGDCFDGSFLGRLAAGDDYVSAATWVSAAAALATTGYGAVDPLPSFEQIRRFMDASYS